MPDEDYNYFDPIGKMKIKGVMIESPNFILTKELFEKYRMKTDKLLQIFICGLKELNLYPDLKSKDKMNRERYKEGIKIPEIPSNKPDQDYIDEAIKYVKNISQKIMVIVIILFSQYHIKQQKNG